MTTSYRQFGGVTLVEAAFILVAVIGILAAARVLANRVSDIEAETQVLASYQGLLGRPVKILQRVNGTTVKRAGADIENDLGIFAEALYDSAGKVSGFCAIAYFRSEEQCRAGQDAFPEHFAQIELDGTQSDGPTTEANLPGDCPGVDIGKLRMLATSAMGTKCDSVQGIVTAVSTLTNAQVSQAFPASADIAIDTGSAYGSGGSGSGGPGSGGPGSGGPGSGGSGSGSGSFESSGGGTSIDSTGGGGGTYSP